MTNESTFEPVRFGPYFLMRRIARGGMAEIFKAKTFLSADIEKPVAVKRILPERCEDQNFISMLTDEARISVSLTHANIVQVYDFGKIDGQYYLAMEWIRGVDLNRLLSALKQKAKKSLELPAAIFIAAQVARALDYAHNKTDNQGKPLKIIHRDVSPHNVMLSFDGDVKLADFGIAKSEANSTLTRTGVIKGKIQYFAPEQIDGEAASPQSDLYALGLILYEALSGKKLLDGDSQAEILGKLMKMDVTLENLPSEIPAPIAKCLVNLLAKDPARRTKTAVDAQRDLEQVLHLVSPGYSGRQLAVLVRDFCDAENAQTLVELDPVCPDVLVTEILRSKAPEEFVAAAQRSQLIASQPDESGDFKTISQLIVKNSGRAAGPAFFESMISFALTDFLKPVFSLAPGGFLIVLIAVLVYFWVAVRRYLKSNSLSRIMASSLGKRILIAGFSVAVWGMIALASFLTPTRGVIASVSDPIARLQEMLTDISSDVKDIKEQTTTIAADVKAIREKLEAAGADGTIVEYPETPLDYYGNARLYALIGETQKAKDSYQKFLEMRPDAIDGHEAFQILLKNTEGIESARSVYQQWQSKYPKEPVVIFAAANLLAEVDRIKTLDELQFAYPDFAAAYLRKADILHATLGDQPTYVRLTMVQQNLKKFRELDATGNFKKYFIDKALLEIELKKADEMENYILLSQDLLKDPVKAEMSRDNMLFAVNFVPREKNIVAFHSKLPTDSDFQNLGFRRVLQTPPDGAFTITVKYQDRFGEIAGPFTLPLEVRSLVAKPFTTSETTPGFKNVFLNIEAVGNISQIKIGIDGAAPNQIYDSIVPISLLKGSHTVVMQGLKNDGTLTPIFSQTFEVE